MNSVEDQEQRERQCKTNLWQAKKDVLSVVTRDLDHTCWEGVDDCHPDNELRLAERGRLKRAEMTGINYIFLCDKGVMHVCLPHRCNLWHGTGKCPLTGIVHGREYRTGKGRSGHYLRGNKSFSDRRRLSYSAHSTKFHGVYGAQKKGKRGLSASMPSRVGNGGEEQRKLKRVKLLSSGNIFKTGARGGMVVERTKVVKAQQPKPSRLPRKRLSETRDRSARRNADIEAKDPVDATDGVTAATKERFDQNVEKLITKLLHSSIRRELNERARVDAKEQWEKAYRQYQKDVAAAGAQETFIEVYEIALNTRAQLPFVILPDDGKLVAKYCKIVRHVWNIVCRYGPKSFRNAGRRTCAQITLGTLYSMRNSGMVLRDVNFLPQNPELLDLPPLSLLYHFQEKSSGTPLSYNRSYTIGANAMTEAYQNALDAGVPASALIINTGLIDAESTRVRGELVKEDVIKVISRPAEALADKWEEDFPFLDHDDIYDQIVTDKAHLKHGDQDECLRNLAARNEEARNLLDEVTDFLIKRYPQISPEEIRFTVVVTKAWKDREHCLACSQELKKRAQGIMSPGDNSIRPEQAV